MSDFVNILTNNPLTLLEPTVVLPSDVNMYLFTRSYPVNPVVLTLDNAALLNNGKPIKIVIHGWQNNGLMNWLNNTRLAYLQKGDFNVVQVDWSAIASKFYSISADGTRGVGFIVANVILNSNVPIQNIHVIGHSLGAQTAGFIGRTLQNLTGQKISRISGLDPARPLFEDVPVEVALSKNDALMVDIIHTDAGKLGIRNPSGTVDFYPNGGSAVQPGCASLDMNDLTNLTSDLVDKGLFEGI